MKYLYLFSIIMLLGCKSKKIAKNIPPIIFKEWIFEREHRDTLFFGTKSILYESGSQHSINFYENGKVKYTFSQIIDLEERFETSDGEWSYDRDKRKLYTTLTVDLKLRELMLQKVSTDRLILYRL